jgi:molecular chaperone GrpE
VQQVQEDSKDIELEKLKKQLEVKSKQCDEYFGMLQRTAAEYDNFRKRTAREKEVLYSEALSDVIAAFLPVIDNIERALGACSQNDEEDEQSIKEGINLIYRQINDILKKLGVEEIKSIGEGFDPKVHDAVMHVEDESYEDGVVVEEFQKGYIYKDKVIRHSVVKVAN